MNSNWSKRFRSTGAGTFEEPVSFAAVNGVFETCERIYIPYLKKYARYEDYCGACRRLTLSMHYMSMGYTRGELKGVLSREPKGGAFQYKNWCVDRIQHQRRRRSRSVWRETYTWIWSNYYPRSRPWSLGRRQGLLSTGTNISLQALLVLSPWSVSNTVANYLLYIQAATCIRLTTTNATNTSTQTFSARNSRASSLMQSPYMQMLMWKATEMQTYSAPMEISITTLAWI